MADNVNLSKHLENLGSIKGFESLISELLKSIPSRNRWIKGALLEFKQIENEVLEKDSAKSTTMRQKGNELYKKSKTTVEYCQVFRAYNKSIAFAPNKSEELALGYANRAMVLFRLKYYNECLTDINRAYCANIPNRSIEKLLVKRVRCMKNTNHPDLDTIYKDSLEWIDKHAKNVKELKAKIEEAYEEKAEPCAQFNTQFKDDLLAEMKTSCPNLNKVQIRRNDTDELALVAARNIQLGEVIAVQKVYIQIPDLDSLYLACWQCHVDCLNPIPCDSCTMATFCSESCKAEAWSKHHEVECPLLHLLKDYMNDYWLPFRICNYALKQIGGILPLMKEVYKMSKTDDIKKEHRIVDGVYHSESYRNVYYTTIKTPIDNLDHGMEALKVCRFVYIIATRTTLFNKKYQGPMLEVMNEKAPKFFAALILRHYEIMNGTFFETSANPLFHIMNHSCIPNSIIVAHRNDQILISIDEIKKGQVLTFSGAPIVLAGRPAERKTEFRLDDCKCELCVLKTPPKIEYFEFMEKDPKKFKKFKNLTYDICMDFRKLDLAHPKTTAAYAHQTRELFERWRPFFATAPPLCREVITSKECLMAYFVRVFCCG